MTITNEQFRADFPEFSSSVTFPNSQVTFWFTVAGNLLNAQRWGNMLDVGSELFVAHNLALEAKAQRSAVNGGIPGENSGALSSKSVDKVSMSYDTAAATENGAGHWNLTIYGTRFIRYAKMFGAGPIHVGIGYVPPGSGGGWSGPLMTPGFSNF